MRILLLAFLFGCSQEPEPLSNPLLALDEQACRRRVHCGTVAPSRLGECLEEARNYRLPVPVDQANLDACLAALDEETCEMLAPPDACLHLLQPDRALGEACTQDVECIVGHCGCDHVCHLEPGDCPMSCGPGELCTDGQCRPRGAEGQPCRDFWFNLDCSAGLFCRNDHCVRPPRVGERCATATITLGQVGSSCAPLAWCNGVVCMARLPEGAVCTEPGSCTAGTQCLDGTCQKFRDIGEACDPEVSGCTLDAVCMDGTCRPIPASPAPSVDECAKMRQ